MTRLLNNEVEHITHLLGFAEGLLEYHSQCYEILKDMVKELNEKLVFFYLEQFKIIKILYNKLKNS